MRIDQYLWCVRYFKSRSMASQACRSGRVKIQDKTVKPSREVLAGDQIMVRRDQIWYEFTVLDIPKNRVGAKLVDIYRMDTTPQEVFVRKEMQALSGETLREQGLGRPTKKDRRELDDFNSETD